MPEADERCGVAAGDERPATSLFGHRIVGGLLALTISAGVAVAQEAGPPGGGGAPAAPAGPNNAAPAAPTTGEPGAPAPGPGAGSPPSLLITPSVQLQEQFTDNVFETSTNRQGDAITILTPGIAVSDQSARIQGQFNYNPEAIKHVAITSEDQVIQNFFGSGTFTAVPNLLFFDATASGSEASRVGGQGFGNTAQIPTSAATQTYGYTGSPYMRFHFGDQGDLEVRYRFGETAFDGNTGAITSPVPGESVGAISNSIYNDYSAKYVTGEAYGRLQLTFLADYADYRTEDSFSSKSTTAALDGSYAITNVFFGLFNAGYDKLEFPGEPTGFIGAYTGPDYSAGFRYRPREDRVIELTYGRSQGQHVFNGDAQYALTKLTTLSASYSQQTSTPQSQLLQNLGQATQLTPGVLTNITSGLPQPLVNPNLALQNGVFRDQNLTAGVTMIGGQRNTYTLYFNRTVETALTAGSFSQTTDGVFLNWGRSLSPDANGSLNGGYSTTTSSGITGFGNTSSDAITLTASYNYTLTPTLTASASYQFILQNGISGSVLGGPIGSSTGSVVVDLVTVSLNKSF